jgi:hypothetical protein
MAHTPISDTVTVLSATALWKEVSWMTAEESGNIRGPAFYQGFPVIDRTVRKGSFEKIRNQ